MTSRHEKAGNTLVTLHIFRLTVPFDIWLCSIEQFNKISKLKKSALNNSFIMYISDFIEIFETKQVAQKWPVRWHSTEYYWWPKSGPLANRRLSSNQRTHMSTYEHMLFRSNKMVILNTYKRRTIIYEPRYEKTGFCICENKDADQLRS